MAKKVVSDPELNRVYTIYFCNSRYFDNLTNRKKMIKSMIIAGIVATSLIMQFDIARAGQLANSYAHLPLSKWKNVDKGWFDTTTMRIAQELTKENGLKDDITYHACMSMLSNDVRFQDQPIGEAYKACVTVTRRDGNNK
jgi:hypothetical protein